MSQLDDDLDDYFSGDLEDDEDEDQETLEVPEDWKGDVSGL